MEYICKNKCFYRNRLWRPGDSLVAEDDEAVPYHFEEASRVLSAPKKVVDEEPKTFSEAAKIDPVIKEMQRTIDAENAVAGETEKPDNQQLIPKKKRGERRRSLRSKA